MGSEFHKSKNPVDLLSNFCIILYRGTHESIISKNHAALCR